MAEVQSVEGTELCKSEIVYTMQWEVKKESFPFHLSICECLITSRINPSDLCSETFLTVEGIFREQY